MRMNWCSAILGINLLVPAAIFAHHSAAEYDRTKPVTMKATVTEFHYVNPHPELFVDVKNEDGSVVHWDIEIGPNPAGLERIGWGKERSEKALKPGCILTLTVAPSKVNPVHGSAQKIVTAEGQHVFGAVAPLAN